MACTASRTATRGRVTRKSAARSWSAKSDIELTPEILPPVFWTESRLSCGRVAAVQVRRPASYRCRWAPWESAAASGLGLKSFLPPGTDLSVGVDDGLVVAGSGFSSGLGAPRQNTDCGQRGGGRQHITAGVRTRHRLFLPRCRLPAGGTPEATRPARFEQEFAPSSRRCRADRCASACLKAGRGPLGMVMHPVNPGSPRCGPAPPGNLSSDQEQLGAPQYGRARTRPPNTDRSPEEILDEARKVVRFSAEPASTA